MVYAYDNWAQLPTKDIYDTQMMAMAVNAAKDMYEKGQQDIKDFNKEYGDFISPFSKDMERYGEMVGGVKDAINQMYAAGIDPLRSAEGRAALSRLINSVNPAEFNMMRSNAKTGYAYLDAIQDLRRKGKYSEAQELFDIMQTGGLGVDKEGNNIYDFANFSTAGRNGWNSFMRTSPIEAATLQELTKSGYEGRTARLLSAADFNDPRLKNYVYDPKYEWSGYLYSDLLKGAPGAILSASADPRMRFFRDLAERKVASSGRPYTQADVEAQFQRDVADANTWALIDPTRKADAYQQAKYNSELSNWVDAQKQAREYHYNNLLKHDLDGDGQIDASEKELAMALKQAEINNKLGLSNTESWTNRQKNNIKEGMNAYADEVNKAKLGCSFSGAKNQLISEGIKNPTTKQVNERKRANQQKYYELVNKSTNPNGVTNENLSYLNAYYNAYQTPVTGEDLKTALALAANLADPEAINDIQTNKKRLPIMFEADGSLNLTRQREVAYIGARLTDGSITNQLYNYLTEHGVEGFIPNNNVTVNRMPYGKYGVWDINFTGRFRKDDLTKFKGAGSDEIYDAIAHAGGRYVTTGGKVIVAEDGDDKGKIKWSDIEYIDLPVSRTIDERAYTPWQIDDYHRKRVYGQSNAAKAAGKTNSE